MAKRKKSTSVKKSLDFESSLLKLKEALNALESEELTLEESLKQYEDGIRFLGQCHLALDSARQKIEQLVSVDENGRMVTQDFDGTASAEITTGSRRSRSAMTTKVGKKAVSEVVTEETDEDEDDLREQLLDETTDMDDSDGLF